MRLRCACIGIALVGLAGCGSDDPPIRPDSARRVGVEELSREQAIRRARQEIERTPAAQAVYLDSVEVVEAGPIWHVMFRRRALVIPAVVTVDVNRHTGAAHFPGDE